MKCKLCNQDKKLLRHSHIIPDFAYKGLYNDKHQIAFARFNKPNNKALIPSAPYDKDILCKECDGNIIGMYENYGRFVLYGGKQKNDRQIKQTRRTAPDGLSSLYLENIDYRKFKLYILSILWKASISKHLLFKNIDLDNHEKIIGNMILNGDPKDFKTYKTCIVLAEENEKLITGLVSEPRKISGSSTFYVFYINRLFYLINFSDTNYLELFDTAGLKEDNTMSIPILTGEHLVAFYDSVIGLKLRKE